MGCCVNHHPPCAHGMLYNYQRRRLWAIVPLDKSNQFIESPINWLRSRVMRQSCRVRFLLSSWHSLKSPRKGVYIKELSRSDLPVSLSVGDCHDFQSVWEDAVHCGQQCTLGRAGIGHPELGSRESKQAGLHAFLSALDCGCHVACCFDPLPLWRLCHNGM